MTLPDWEGAACRGPDVSPEWWFPPRKSRDPKVRRNTTLAKGLCQVCVHQVECLQWALGGQERYGVPLQGVWGGLDEEQRSAVTARRRERTA